MYISKGKNTKNTKYQMSTSLNRWMTLVSVPLYSLLLPYFSPLARLQPKGKSSIFPLASWERPDCARAVCTECWWAVKRDWDRGWLWAEGLGGASLPCPRDFGGGAGRVLGGDQSWVSSVDQVGRQCLRVGDSMTKDTLGWTESPCH